MVMMKQNTPTIRTLQFRSEGVFTSASLGSSTSSSKPSLTAFVNVPIHKKVVEQSLAKEPIKNSLKDRAIFIYPHNPVNLIATYA